MGKPSRYASALLYQYVPFVAGIHGNALPSNSRVERDNLRGVTPIYIQISFLPQWAEDNGVTRAVLREQIEEQLKAHKIAISDLQTDTGGILSVIVTGSEKVEVTSPQPTKGYGYVCEVSASSKMSGCYMINASHWQRHGVM